jgi:hypothetical protein
MFLVEFFSISEAWAIPRAKFVVRFLALPESLLFHGIKKIINTMRG